MSHLQETRILIDLQEKRIPYGTCRRSAYRIDLQENCIQLCRNPDEIMSGGNCNCVLGERSEKKLDTVQSSNNTVERTIQDLVADINKLVSRLKSSFDF